MYPSAATHAASFELLTLYCRSSDSQHNPRLRIGAGHSMMTNTRYSAVSKIAAT